MDFLILKVEYIESDGTYFAALLLPQLPRLLAADVDAAGGAGASTKFQSIPRLRM